MSQHRSAGDPCGQSPFISLVAWLSDKTGGKRMRGLFYGVAVALALTAGVAAAECSGQGSVKLLTFDSWSLDAGGVELAYRLDDDKPVTRLSAHVYFADTAGDRQADAALDLVDAAGLPRIGTATVLLDKPMRQRLSAAAAGGISAYACTNVVEYLDGSGVIID
jgi:hypothetical protein